MGRARLNVAACTDYIFHGHPSVPCSWAVYWEALRTVTWNDDRHSLPTPNPHPRRAPSPTSYKRLVRLESTHIKRSLPSPAFDHGSLAWTVARRARHGRGVRGRQCFPRTGVHSSNNAVRLISDGFLRRSDVQQNAPHTPSTLGRLPHYPWLRTSCPCTADVGLTSARRSP